MIEMRKANIIDLPQLDKLEQHFTSGEIKKKIEESMYYIASYDNQIIGLLRYGLFWDQIPFMNLLIFIEDYRRRGFGSKLVTFWEKEMQAKGYKLVMTSTQVDEEAQHFYRTLGYKDIGGFTFPEEPLELVMLKIIEE